MLIYQTPKGKKHTVYVYLKDGRVERFKNIVEINRLHADTHGVFKMNTTF